MAIWRSWHDEIVTHIVEQKRRPLPQSVGRGRRCFRKELSEGSGDLHGEFDDPAGSRGEDRGVGEPKRRVDGRAEPAGWEA